MEVGLIVDISIDNQTILIIAKTAYNKGKNKTNPFDTRTHTHHNPLITQNDFHLHWGHNSREWVCSAISNTHPVVPCDVSVD